MPQKEKYQILLRRCQAPPLDNRGGGWVVRSAELGGGALGLGLGPMAFVGHVHLTDANAGVAGSLVEGFSDDLLGPGLLDDGEDGLQQAEAAGEGQVDRTFRDEGLDAELHRAAGTSDEAGPAGGVVGGEILVRILAAGEGEETDVEAFTQADGQET